MSPNESQLRSALRDGEGDFVDPDTVIARARAMTQARHDRRVRYASVAAIVAVVSGIGVAAGVTRHGGTAAGTASSADRAHPAAGGAAAGAASQPVAGPMKGAPPVGCPTTAPRLHLPDPGGSGSPGATASLFSGPVESVKICAYEQQGGAPIAGANGQAASTVLTGQRATALAASLDAAPTLRPRTPCPMYASRNGRTLVLIALSTTGQAMKAITVTVAQNPCNLPVTNGTAIRFNWSPPASLDDFIAHLRPAGGGALSHAPRGKVTGSPIRS